MKKIRSNGGLPVSSWPNKAKPRPKRALRFCGPCGNGTCWHYGDCMEIVAPVPRDHVCDCEIQTSGRIAA